MDRNREARRANIVGSNGFNRRRHRTNSLRDSPDEDGGLELQESGRLRDRVKKDRDRERDRDRDRERERARERERERERERDLREKSSRSKRRRGERLASNREDIGGDETSEEESLNDDEDDDGDEENTTGGGGVRLLTQAGVSVNHHDGHVSNHHHSHSSSFSQHNSNSTTNTVSSYHHQLQHRKSYPPNTSSVKISRPPPVWRSSSEMIREMVGSLVPRRRRSASTKRSHDWMSIEQNFIQPWSSPPRQSAGPTTTPTPPHPPMSPTSSNASVRKKLKPTANNSGQKVKPPKAAAKPSANSSNPEELEIEIAEVLYGLMTQSQAPSSKKEESREINRLSSDAKSRNSSPISNSSSANNPISGSNSAPLSAVAPKRKRPREMPENSSSGVRSSSISAKPDADQDPRVEKTLGPAAENGYEMAGNSVDPLAAAPVAPELTKMGSEVKPAAEELKESRDSVAKEEVTSPKEKESSAVRADVDSPPAVTSSTTKANSTVAGLENRKEEKFEIDLMAPPPQVREAKADLSDKKPTVSISDASLKPDENGKGGRAEEKKKGEEVDLEKSERDGVNAAGNGNKSQSLTQKQHQPLTEKSGNSTSSLPLTMPMGSWPTGLPPMGYMAPLQGVVSMEGGPGHIQPLFTQPRPKRCATHCHIARNIHYLQQLMKINPFWPPPASASLFGSKPNDPASARVAQDKAQNVAKEKASPQPASLPDSAQRKQQQQPILIQQAMPPSNLLGPAFIFPLNQQQSAATRPSGAKSPSTAGVSSSATSGSAVTSSSTSAAAVSFNYPNMASNETQYLAIVQNNGYSFPIPAAAVGAAPPNYRGNPAQAMPLFNGPFYSSQMIHPSQLQSQLLQPHQNASASTASSASQKQQQQQRIQSGGVSTTSGTASLSSQKTQPSQQLQMSHNQYVHQSRPRQHDGEPAREEDSPSTTDSRGSRASMNIYGQNFAMPIHPPNFGLMTHPAATATNASSNHADKKGHQQGSKAGPDSLPAHSFAMTFGTMNGATDMAQNHAIFQNPSEVTRQMMAAQKKNSRVSDDGKSGGVEEEDRKSMSGKASGGQSIAFSRPDLGRSNQMSVQNAHSNIQAQLQQQMQQQLKHHHQQQQHMSVNRSKVGVNSNGSMYSEHLNLNSNTSSKFPSVFPQNLVQSSSSSPSVSPQWKASARASAPSSSTTTTTLKNLPQQQQQQQQQISRISFGGNQKQQGTNQTSSPTTSSVSKGASGSPRTSSASTNNKTTPSLSAQPPNHKSPSILGNPHVQKSQSQQQMPKAMQQQQQQLFFSNPYAQSNSSGKSSNASMASGYYMARRPTDQHHQQSPVTSGGGLSLSTNDPATAIAAATANVKGGGGVIHASQFAAQPVLPAGFSYAHPVQVKPSAEQKQPAGNDSLHQWQPEKK